MELVSVDCGADSTLSAPPGGRGGAAVLGLLVPVVVAVVVAVTQPGLLYAQVGVQALHLTLRALPGV